MRKQNKPAYSQSVETELDIKDQSEFQSDFEKAVSTASDKQTRSIESGNSDSAKDLAAFAKQVALEKTRQSGDELLTLLLRETENPIVKDLKLSDRVMITSGGSLFAKKNIWSNRGVDYTTVQMLEVAIKPHARTQSYQLSVAGKLSLPDQPGKIRELANVLFSLAEQLEQ